MPTANLPDDFYEFLQQHATETVGHLFGVEPSTARDLTSVRPSTRGRRQPKADLFDLTQAGLLRRGQKLFLHDYQGRRIPGMEAEVRSKQLVRDGRPYSMSRLATLLLGKQGYSSDSVRGPAHWFTEAGESVRALWEQYQRNRLNPKAGAA